MKHLFEVIFDCHFGTETFWFQIIGLFFLTYFFILSFVALWKEFIIEGQQQGTFPAIGFVYMLLSSLYIFILIMGLDDIAEIVSNKFIHLYTEINGVNIANELVLSDLQISEMTFYSEQMKMVLVFILTAFAINFSKAFFSLNSLEFGTLNSIHLKDIFKDKKTRSTIEVIVRIFIAFIFIAIEKQLSFTDYTADKFKHIEFFQEISIQMGVLYGLLIFWLFILLTITYKNVKFTKWNWLNGIQFFLGIIVAYLFYKYSLMDIGNLSEWNRENSSWTVAAKMFSVVLIVVIVLTEIFRWHPIIKTILNKNNNDNGNS